MSGTGPYSLGSVDAELWLEGSAAGSYIFDAELLATDERVRLWIDNTVVIDQWSSLLQLQPSAVLSLAPAILYSLRLEYRSAAPANRLRLSWRNAAANFKPLASLRLLALESVAGAFEQRIRATVICAALSTAHGSGLTVATAGVAAQFTLIARDEFGNVAEWPDGSLTLAVNDSAVSAKETAVGSSVRVLQYMLSAAGVASTAFGLKSLSPLRCFEMSRQSCSTGAK